MNKKSRSQPSKQPSSSIYLLFSAASCIVVLYIVYRSYSIVLDKSVAIPLNVDSNLRNNEIKILTTTTTTPIIARKKRVAYAITVTKDGHFVDGALVLGYSAKKVHDAASGYPSQYEADLIAFVAPTVKYARPVLEAYGWKVLERNLPVELNEIENKAYAESMRNSGCCGADEFLKLWAYTLTEYERVIHLDMDSIIYQNMVCIYLTYIYIYIYINSLFIQYNYD